MSRKSNDLVEIHDGGWERLRLLGEMGIIDPAANWEDIDVTGLLERF